MNRTASTLKLDPQNAWLGGVCSGVARYLDTDDAIVRVATVVAGLFMPKIVASIYLIGWLVLDRRENRS